MLTAASLVALTSRKLNMAKISKSNFDFQVFAKSIFDPA